MGLFRRTEKRSAGSTNPVTSWLSGLMPQTQVTTESAFKTTTVHTCISLLAETIASLPMQSYRKSNGRKAKIDNDISYLLETRPNILMSSYELKKNLITQLLVYGNAYVWIQRDQNKKPINLWLLSSQATEPQIDLNGRLYYNTTLHNNVPKEVNALDMIHIKTMSLDGIKGISYLDVLQDNLIIDQKINSLFKSYYSKNLFGSVVLELSTTAGPNMKNAAVESLQQLYAGDSFRVIPIGNGEKLSPFPTKSISEYKLTESKKQIATEICNLFHIPLGLLGGIGAEQNNIGDLYLQLIKSLDGLITGIEEEFSFKVYSQRNIYVEISYNKLLRTDIKTQAETLTSLVGNKIITINEARNELGYEEREETNEVGNEIDPSTEPTG